MTVNTLRTKAIIENYDEVTAFIESSTKDIRQPEVEQDILLACEELVVNVFRYAYPNGEEGDIIIRCAHFPEKREFEVTIRDKGVAFNPLARKDNNIKKQIEARKQGGLGILMAKKLTSSMHYTREQDENILVAVKKY